jgi:demethylmenaquinone methyltransferase/2-methoxy-6-polyprenyl-1,4-benzoquinol methylase
MKDGRSDDELLAEQRAFYERRAPEYDEWWQRRGRYDQGPEAKARWDEQIETVARGLDDFKPSGDILEIAGGTGWWTNQLVRYAGSLTVVDSSADALALNARRNGLDVEYIEADIFGWSAPRRYDVVFFSFWLSHVPRDRFADFWNLVATVLKRDGRAFLIDNRHDPSAARPDPYVLEHDADVQLRTLSDGSTHRVVKIFYEPAELEDLVRRRGWELSLSGTTHFIYGGGEPR